VSEAAKHHLVRSHAGVRLIAQLTFFNRGDFERLRTYLQDNYAAEALSAISAKARLAELKAIYRLNGKMRVEQVVAAGEHEVIVALEAERGDAVYLAQLLVHEEYPHKVLFFDQGKMDKVEADET
jgi:uncharacterized protein with GYD domain